MLPLVSLTSRPSGMRPSTGDWRSLLIALGQVFEGFPLDGELGRQYNLLEESLNEPVFCHLRFQF